MREPQSLNKAYTPPLSLPQTTPRPTLPGCKIWLDGVSVRLRKLGTVPQGMSNMASTLRAISFRCSTGYDATYSFFFGPTIIADFLSSSKTLLVSFGWEMLRTRRCCCRRHFFVNVVTSSLLSFCWECRADVVFEIVVIGCG